MSDPTRGNLDRLEAAVSACMNHRLTAEESDAEFLAHHEELRDLLEPMLRSAEAAPDEEESPHQAPRHLDDYRLIREIGRGGMGVVYEAEQTSLRRRVALKVLPPRFTQEPGLIARFRREAAAVAKLRHPGIVEVYTVGEFESTHFMAMQIVRGGSFADHVATRRHAREVARLVSLVADALEHAHAHGIIHRDIKPQNILMSKEALPMVVDFGLAKDITLDSLSPEGALAGTPHYMSPEQARPGFGPLDHRTDIYSLGVVLYESLSGQRPFEDDTTHRLLAQVVQTEAPPLRSFAADIPRDLEQICQTAMAKRAVDRYATAGAMAEDLRRFLHGDPITARPPGPWSRGWRWVQRHRLAVAVIAIVAGLILAISLGYSFYRHQQDANIQLAMRNVDRVVQLMDTTRMREAPGQQELYREHLREAAEAYAHLRRIAPSQPRLRRQVAATLGRLAASYTSARRFDLAQDIYDDAIAISKELLREQPSNLRVRTRHAAFLHDRALSQTSAGHWPQAERGIADAITIWSAVAENHETGLSTVSTLCLSRALCNRASRRVRRGWLKQAKVDLDASLSHWKSLPESSRSEFDARLDRARIHAVRANVLLKSSRLDESQAQYKTAIAALQELLLTAKNDYECRYWLACSRWGLAVSLGRHAAETTKTEFARATSLWTELIRDFPERTALNIELLSIRIAKAKTLLDLGELGASQRAARAALDQAEQLSQTLPESVAVRSAHARALDVAVQSLGLSRHRGVPPDPKDLSNWIVWGEQAVSTFASLYQEQRLGPNALRRLGATRSNLAGLFLMAKKFGDARRLAEQAIRDQDSFLTHNPGDRVATGFLSIHHQIAIRSVIPSRDHRAIATWCARLSQLKPRNPSTQAWIGIHAAMGASMAKRDASLHGEERTAAVESMGALAVRSLRNALDHGFEHGAMIRTTKAFHVLADRADFQALLARIPK